MKKIHIQLILSVFLITATLHGTSINNGNTNEKVKWDTFRKLVKGGCKSPRWVNNFIAKKSYYETCCNSVTIYATQENESAILSLYKKVHLVKIDQTTYYKNDYVDNKQSQLRVLNNGKSYYENYYADNQELAPITVSFAKVPVRLANERTKKNFENYQEANVINLSAPNFSNEQEVDYQYFFGADKQLTPQKKKALYMYYYTTFALCWNCLVDKKIKRIVFSYFGCGSSAALYPGGIDREQQNITFVREIWLPAFKESLKKYSVKLKNSLKEIVFIQSNNVFTNEIKTSIENQGFTAKYWGTTVPEIFFEDKMLGKDEERATTVVCNPSTNGTLKGNGCQGNNSLEGRWGQSSGIGPLFWTETNPFLTENSIEFKPVIPSKGFKSEKRPHEAIIKTAEKLYCTYDQIKDAFPRWFFDFIIEKPDLYDKYCKSVSIYVPSEKIPMEVIRKLHTEKEPSNIKMDKYFDSEKLETYFGYKESYYISSYNNKKQLAPLTVLAFTTPIMDCTHKNYTTQPFKKDLVIHIINPLGLAFDDTRQPDYKDHLDDGKLKRDKDKKLQEHLKNNIRAIFQYTIEHGMTKIIMNKFGCGVFLELYNNKNAFFKDHWLPAFQEVFNAYAPFLEKAGVTEISFVGKKENPTNSKEEKEQKDLRKLKNYISEYKFKSKFKFKSETYGKIPNIIFDGILGAQKALDKTVFVSAGDAHTIFGNGHLSDASLEGAYGRISIGALLTWIPTNPYLGNNLADHIKVIQKDPSQGGIISKIKLVHIGYIGLAMLFIYLVRRYFWLPKPTH